MKNKNCLYVSLCVAIGSLSMSTQVLASASTPPVENPLARLPRGTTSQQLADVYSEASKKLEVVETLIAAGDYGKALLHAKNVSDVIKAKAGIATDIQYRERIKIDGVIELDDLKRPFHTLTNIQQEKILDAVKQHKMGYFLTLLNLSKRSVALYTKAFYTRIKVDGALLERDINKIRQDLLEIHAIPVELADSTVADGTMLLFDDEVTTRDQAYFFNRELLSIAMSFPELSVDEKGFDELLAKSRAKVFDAHANKHAYYSKAECVSTVSKIDFFNATQTNKLCAPKTNVKYIDCILNASQGYENAFSGPRPFWVKRTDCYGNNRDRNINCSSGWTNLLNTCAQYLKF